jgi:hypothetical protein
MCALAESVVERHAQLVNGQDAESLLASAQGSPPPPAEEEVNGRDE